jgi:hypothetical protein
MEFLIAREIRQRADRCSRNYECLQGEASLQSEPEVQFTGPQRFLCREPDACAYKFPFGSTFFCTCPVRRAVFDAYGK